MLYSASGVEELIDVSLAMRCSGIFVVQFFVSVVACEHSSITGNTDKSLTRAVLSGNARIFHRGNRSDLR